MAVEDLVRKATQIFRTRFGETPNIAAVAPGRVNLIGEHIDYNDGFVLPLAIDRYTVIVGSPSESSGQFQIYSQQQDQLIDFSLNSSPSQPKGSWGSYLEGVISGFQARAKTVPGFQAVAFTDIPVGGGLSSSAALEVSFATFLESLLQLELPPKEKALLCQKAEHQFAGIPCGIMDQFSSVFGKSGQVLLIDCQSQAVSYAPFNTDEMAVLIIDSGVRHTLADGQYAIRKQQCEEALEILGARSWRDVTQSDLQSSSLSGDLLKRAKHVVTEISRTQSAYQALESSDWTTFGRLMGESHSSLRDDYQVSCQELDCLVDIANGLGRPNGVYGARMTGGGFGGCTVNLVNASEVDSIKNKILESYRKKTGLEAQGLITTPSFGAKVMPINSEKE